MSFEFMIVMFGVIMVIIIATSLWEFKRSKENDAKPKISVEAQILNIDRRRSKLLRSRVVNVTPKYIITFLLSDNEKKEFEVSVWNYEWIKVNDKGMLTYQDTRFISFRSQNIIIPRKRME